MSTSQADIALAAAKKHVQAAIEELGQIVVEQVDGSKSFTTEYKRYVQLAFDQLIHIRGQLE